MADQGDSSSEAVQTPAGRFFRYFQHEITALQEQMDRLGDTALIAGERKDATDHCLASITKLSGEVKDASATLPSYDLRTYTEAIKALQDRLAEVQAQHAPKQKFSFKTRKNESAVSLQDVAELAAQKQKSALNYHDRSGTSSFAATPNQPSTPSSEIPTTQRLSVLSAQSESDVPRRSSQTLPPTEPLAGGDQLPSLTTSTTTTAISSQGNSYIIVPASASRINSPCSLSSLTSCCIDLSIPEAESTPFASLTISDVESSLLLCGSVAGPVHITGVKNSTIVISCRQFRMHDCENLDIYLYSTSRPIIENCKDLRFAEMPEFYASLLHTATSSFKHSTNLWNQVDDFNWLRPEQSPNWKVQPVEQRLSDTAWHQIIPSKPGMSVREILNIVGIK